MDNKKKDKNTKKTFDPIRSYCRSGLNTLCNGIAYRGGGFAQRGLLATGLITPNVKNIAQDESDENETTTTSAPTPADFNLTLMDEEGKTISWQNLKTKLFL